MIYGRRSLISIVSMTLILLMSGSIVIYMRTSPRFEITRIGITGNAQLTATAIVEYLNLQPHTNIFQVRLEQIQQHLESLRWVKFAEVYRSFPDKLNITLAERVPFALLKLDELYLVDQDGVILGALASGSAIQLPIITGAILNRVDPDGENSELGEALYSISELMNPPNTPLKNIRKITIECLDSATFISNEPFPEIRVSLREYRANFEHLQQIYPELHPENLAYIDLRFKKRIIVQSNKS